MRWGAVSKYKIAKIIWKLFISKIYACSGCTLYGRNDGEKLQIYAPLKEKYWEKKSTEYPLPLNQHTKKVNI